MHSSKFSHLFIKSFVGIFHLLAKQSTSSGGHIAGHIAAVIKCTLIAMMKAGEECVFESAPANYVEFELRFFRSAIPLSQRFFSSMVACEREFSIV